MNEKWHFLEPRLSTMQPGIVSRLHWMNSARIATKVHTKTAASRHCLT